MLLHSLPSEVLLEIFKYITNTSTLAALSISCRRVHDLVEPILYHSTTHTQAHTLALLTRTILSTPRLAQHINSLSATATYPYYTRFLGRREFFSSSQLSQVRSRIVKFNGGVPLAAEDYWVRAVSDCVDWEALTAFLLLLLPNLNSLDLPNNPAKTTYLTRRELRRDQPKYFINEVIQGATKAQQGLLNSPIDLRSLTSVRYTSCEHTWNAHDTGSLRRMAAIMALPSLETFEGRRVYLHGIAPSPMFPSGIKSLTLAESDRSDNFAEVLGNMPYLRSLSLSISTKSERSPALWTEYIADLAGIRGQLEELVITTDLDLDTPMAFDRDTNQPVETRHPRICVHDFEKLRKFEAPVYLVMGFPSRHAGSEDDHPTYTFEQQESFLDQLPTGLQRLAITHCDATTYNLLHFVLRRKAASVEFLQHMKSIQLQLWIKDFDTLEDPEWDSYQQQFAELGIQLTRNWTSLSA